MTAGSVFLAWRLFADDAETRGAPDVDAPAPRPDSRPAPATEGASSSRADTVEALVLAPEPGAIRGVVTDRGGIPVNHATVRFTLKAPPGQRTFALVARFDETAKVDGEGKFSLVVPGGGLYQVVAEADGFAPAVRAGVKPGEEIELMLDVGASLAGVVVDKNGGRGIEGASVEVAVEKGALVRTVETSPLGEFRIQDLPAGKLAISATHDLFVPRSGIDQAIQAGESATIRIELDSGKCIRGQVLAADDGHSIEGAVITVRKKKTRSDATGRFAVRGLEPELHEFQVAADGFQAEQLQINLSGSRSEAVAEIKLNRGATIRGRVQNEKSDPVANAELKLFESGEGWGENWMFEDWATRHMAVKTGADGTFKLTGIPAREWLVLAMRVRSQGYPDTFERGIKVMRNDDELYVPITIRQGAVIAGRVVDQENRPVAGARIELRPQNTGWYQGGEDPNLTVTGTDSDGAFRFQGLGKTSYNVLAQVRGFSSAWKNDVDLTTGVSQENLVLTVEAGSPVRGIVLDPEDRPIAGANVNIWTQKGNGQAVSGPDGTFVVESLPKGPYDLQASAVGYAATRLSKQLPAGDAGLRIVMKREAVLKGTVVDAVSKKPVEKFTAFLFSDDNRGSWRSGRYGGPQSDPLGKFQVQAPQGTYRLEIIAQGYVRNRKEGISLQPGTDPEPLKIELRQGGAIEGKVRGETGQPEAGVQVFVGKDDGSGTYFAQTFSEHDGYFIFSDLDTGTYRAAFQKHEYPMLVESGVYVSGAAPATVEVQIERTAAIWFDVIAEQPRPEETVAGAPGDAAAPKPWRMPRVRAWIESLEDAPIAISQDWNRGETRFRPIRRRDLWTGGRQQRFSMHLNDLPAGRFVLRATALGYEDVRVPFQIQRGARWRLPVEMRLLPKELRPSVTEGPRRRSGVWLDENGIRHEYFWYEDE